MIETMRQAPGVGLAAPQVNVSQRILVVEYGEEPDEDEDPKPAPKKLYALINPEISRASKETEIANEGCLSIPGIVGDVERSLSVTVLGQNRHGQPVKIKASGWLARIFQHEIDHLNGVLFIDRAEKVFQLQEEAPPPGV
jgi:peptide deformylase